MLSILAAPIAALGWLLSCLGAKSDAVKCLQEADQLQESQQSLGIAAGIGGPTDIWLVEGYLVLGRLAEAQRCVERLLQAEHIRWARPVGLYLFGGIETYPDRFNAEKGEDYYRRALALLEGLGMRPWIAHCHLGLSKLYRRSGKQREAQEHFSTATTMYREMGMTYWLEKAEAEMRALE